jgi:MFS family permease
MFRSMKIQRSGVADMFVKRELDYIPEGGDRYFMLIVKAIASFMGSLAVTIGALGPSVLKSENLSVVNYGHIVGGTGIAAAVIALTASQLADKFTRVRVLLWGMIIPIVFHFAMAFLPDNKTALFIFLYVGLATTETWTIVTVSALLRDFSPRTGRALGVGLVTIGSQSALWLSFFLAGHILNRLGSWQHMFLLYGIITVLGWLLLVLFAREPRKGIRVQITRSMLEKERVEQHAAELERTGIKVQGFWAFILADWRLGLLAVGQGLFLIGYATFGAYGPIFVVQVFKRTPQDAANLTSYLYAAILVGLFLGGILSDWLRLRKIPGMLFTTIGGLGLIFLAQTVGHKLTNTEILIIFSVNGFFMAMMWSPTTALFSENAEDVATTRMTTAFGFGAMVYAILIQAWIFEAPTFLANYGWAFIWTFCGICSIATAVVIALCKGPWGRFPLEASQEELAREAEVLAGGEVIAAAGVP